ncbi:MAG: Uma2 family endonuclease [Vicinamibacterales bacterium]
MPVALTKRRFTADDYQRMGQAGILSKDDRVELIAGEVVAMTPIGPRHNAAVNRATRAMVTLVGDKAIVQVQGSVRLDLYHEPQPDLVLLRPRADYYASRLPGPADIFLVVEVAESSIDYDREVKARLYAELGVQEYWLVDLNENLVSSHSKPEGGSYLSLQRHHRGQSLAPSALPDCVIAVDGLLAE